MPEPVDLSPLVAIPALGQVGSLLADAVVVTDVHRRVIVWNAAAEALYGIRVQTALGTPIDHLFESTIVGAGTNSAGARAIALETGSWRGRVADVPKVGRHVGQERIVENVLTRLEGPDGEAVGVLSIKRDVTPSVRLEREIVALGELASASGETRSRSAAATRALDVLHANLGAISGVIAVADGPSNTVIARKGIPEAVADAISAVPWAESPAVRAVSTTGRVIKGQVDRLPLTPSTRRHIASTGARSLVMVGLHRDEDLIGVLVLCWAERDPVLPSDATILLVASHLARSLENARLVEEILRRVDSERATILRLRALDELTRVASQVATIDELAKRSAELIDTALGAAGTAYGLLGPDGDVWESGHLSGVHPAIATWLRDARPDLRSAFRRWKAGEGAFLEPFVAGVVPMDMIELARQAGITAYAAIPIRVGDAIVGGIAAYFDRPLADLHVDRGALDRIATVASISVENFRLRERLEASEARYRTLFERAPDALLVTQADGTVIDANDAATRLFGADREWLFGRAATELSEPEDGRSEVARPDSSTRRGVGARRDGSRFPQELETADIAADGEPRVLLRIRDLTEEGRLQGELIQAQKMEATGQLVSGVAHELNNPLTAILGFSQLIRRDPALPEELRANADLLIDEATRTRRIVQNLLDFARQRPPERHPTSIKTLIDSVLALQTYALGPGQVEVELDVADDLPLVALDRGQLQQVLINLTHNAVYAIKHGGGSRIRITAAAEGRGDAARVRVTVMDDGPGVAPEHVGRLFDAFFTTKPPSDGTGLGLPVSFGIVHAHGGELRYIPSGFGRGAAFTFELPVHGIHHRPGAQQDHGGSGPGHAGPSEVGDVGAAIDTPARSPDPTPAPAPAGRTAASPTSASATRTILVVDDEAAIRTLLQRALRGLGHDALLAATGDEAVAAATTSPVDAVLCDHQMVGMSGREVFHAIVAERPDLRDAFVMMSGDVTNDDLTAFTEVHPVAILAKPFDLDTLAAVVAAILPADQRA